MLETHQKIEAALEQRQDWLVSRNLGFIQSNGVFAMREGALSRLEIMEVKNAGAKLAEKMNVVFLDRSVLAGNTYTYVGYLKLESGYWGAVLNHKGELQMAPLDKKPEFSRQDRICFEKGQGRAFVMQGHQKSQSQHKAPEIERDEDMER